MKRRNITGIGTVAVLLLTQLAFCAIDGLHPAHTRANGR